MVRHARDEAAGLVARARDAAAAKDASLAADLEALVRELETAIAAERQLQERGLAESAQREARAFDDTSPDEVAALARHVVERVIGAEP